MVKLNWKWIFNLKNENSKLSALNLIIIFKDSYKTKTRIGVNFYHVYWFVSLLIMNRFICNI